MKGITPFALAALAITLSSSASALTMHNLSSPDISAFSTSGTGTSGNPLIITETVNSVPADGLKIGFRGLAGSPYPMYVVKRVTNNTNTTWVSFEQELGHQNIGGWIYGINSNSFLGSNDFDGLSFDQGASGRTTTIVNAGSGFYGLDGTFNSDKWTHVFIDETTNTRDFIQFFSHSNPGHVVNHGDTVEMVFRITWSSTSYGTNTDFILRQDVNVGVVPEPATLSILGLAGLAALRRRRK